jgi:chromosomal replication initiator protein
MIGDRLGGRDHTTVIHSYEKIKGLLNDNPQLMREVDDIRAILV